VTARAILRLLDRPGRITSGRVLLDPGSARQQDLAALDPESRAMRAVRGGRIGLIFQEPMTALSVHYTVGNQIVEAMRAHDNVTKEAARERAIALLHEVGIPRPELRIHAYPFQLSGGLRQRVGIALALAANPGILIADEPTTALDVTTQAQILTLLRRLQRTKGVALMLITHDMGVIAQMADDVAVMYLGRIVEFAPVAQLFSNPRHPYTRALLRSVPNLRATPRERLATIGGAVPHSDARPAGCPFHPRCPEIIVGRCSVEAPPTLPPDQPGASCFHPFTPDMPALAEARA
jgi:peptide/nickel transport system ATP-binding protein